MSSPPQTIEGMEHRFYAEIATNNTTQNQERKDTQQDNTTQNQERKDTQQDNTNNLKDMSNTEPTKQLFYSGKKESFENEILVDNSEQENDIPRDNELNVDTSDHIYENV